MLGFVTVPFFVQGGLARSYLSPRDPPGSPCDVLGWDGWAEESLLGALPLDSLRRRGTRRRDRLVGARARLRPMPTLASYCKSVWLNFRCLINLPGFSDPLRVTASALRSKVPHERRLAKVAYDKLVADTCSVVRVFKPRINRAAARGAAARFTFT